MAIEEKKKKKEKKSKKNIEELEVVPTTAVKEKKLKKKKKDSDSDDKKLKKSKKKETLQSGASTPSVEAKKDEEDHCDEPMKKKTKSENGGKAYKIFVTKNEAPTIAATMSDAASPAPHDDAEVTTTEADKPKRKRKRKAKGKPAADAQTEVNDTVARASSNVCLTIYVEGISYDADENDVKQFMIRAGTVTDVRMPRWHDSGKPRGYAHVEFKDGEMAMRAVKELNGERLMGRFLKIELAKAPKAPAVPTNVSTPPPDCTTIFVKNLPYNSDEESVKKALARFGSVKEVRLAYDHGEQKRFKGFGYVHFQEPGSAQAAVKAFVEGTLLVGGRRVIVDFEANARPKGSFKRADGRNWHKS